jgi:hypothetical protein
VIERVTVEPQPAVCPGASPRQGERCVKLLDNLLYPGYGMMPDWREDDEELMRVGWQPPQGEDQP